jgi:hypothetical protein
MGDCPAAEHMSSSAAVKVDIPSEPAKPFSPASDAGKLDARTSARASPAHPLPAAGPGAVGAAASGRQHDRKGSCARIAASAKVRRVGVEGSFPAVMWRLGDDSTAHAYTTRRSWAWQGSVARQTLGLRKRPGPWLVHGSSPETHLWIVQEHTGCYTRSRLLSTHGSVCSVWSVGQHAAMA